ncbi:MAG: SDR family oxidoreductase [Candidatus Margulisbacteria bacterium]|nr:SDR family oxidoreductase [Candidatus Margulisiibacteriota bacterium]
MDNKNYTLITGGSCGIGLALAYEFARHGHNLILVSRKKETLEETAKQIRKQYPVEVITIAQDLTLTDSANQLFQECEKQNLEINILVNNAGFGNYGFFAHTDTQTDLELITLNITALTHLTKLFLPAMIQKKSGQILNVGSMAAFYPGPFMDTYFASKAYVVSFSEALNEEVRCLGIKVSCLCPGPTESNFGKRANYKFKSHNKIKMTAEDVARITYKNMMKKKVIIIPGTKNKLLYYANLLIPRFLKPRVVKYYSGFKDFEVQC